MEKAYEFTPISETEQLEAVPEGATVLVESGGEIKRVPGDGLGGSGGGIKTAIIKQEGYDNALLGIALTAGVEEINYTCTNMTYTEAKQTMLSGEPFAIMIMAPSSNGVACYYSTNVSLSQNNDCICFSDGVNYVDIYWGYKGISTIEGNAFDFGV